MAVPQNNVPANPYFTHNIKAGENPASAQYTTAPTKSYCLRLLTTQCTPKNEQKPPESQETEAKFLLSYPGLHQDIFRTLIAHPDTLVNCDIDDPSIKMVKPSPDLLISQGLYHVDKNGHPLFTMYNNQVSLRYRRDFDPLNMDAPSRKSDISLKTFLNSGDDRIELEKTLERHVLCPESYAEAHMVMANLIRDYKMRQLDGNVNNPDYVAQANLRNKDLPDFFDRDGKLIIRPEDIRVGHMYATARSCYDIIHYVEDHKAFVKYEISHDIGQIVSRSFVAVNGLENEFEAEVHGVYAQNGRLKKNKKEIEDIIAASTDSMKKIIKDVSPGNIRESGLSKLERSGRETRAFEGIEVPSDPSGSFISDVFGDRAREHDLKRVDRFNQNAKGYGYEHSFDLKPHEVYVNYKNQLCKAVQHIPQASSILDTKDKNLPKETFLSQRHGETLRKNIHRIFPRLV